MPDTYGPFDGTDWAEAQWYRDAPLWSASGVVGDPVSSWSQGPLNLGVNGMSVTTGPGRARVRGAAFERTGSGISHTVSPNGNASLSRRDRLVLRRNLAAKTVTTVLLTGTPAATPLPPALTKDEAGNWDIPLFAWTARPNNDLALTGLTDERPWVSPSGGDLAVYGPDARNALGASDLSVGQRVFEVGANRDFLWRGGKLIKQGGLPELVYSAGNLGGSGIVQPGSLDAIVFNVTLTSPVTSDDAHLHLVAAVKTEGAGSIAGSVGVNLAASGLDYEQQFTAYTGGAPTPATIERRISLPAGAWSLLVTLSLANAGPPCRIDYAALTVTI